MSVSQLIIGLARKGPLVTFVGPAKSAAAGFI